MAYLCRPMKHPANNSSRIESVDALRGFAVMAIVLVHNLEHFIYPVYPTDAPAWLGTLDRIVLDGTFSLFAGKAYAIFALLFGLTFFLQNDRQKREGKDFGWIFLWRMLMLAVFLLQVLLSRWWLSRHRQGPLETLWHKWTWMRFKRAA